MTETRTLVPGASHPKSIHQIELFRIGPPASGGAFNRYEIQHKGLAKWGLYFQSKPCETNADVDGLTNEILILAVIDRLECFQAGPFACEENQAALEFVRSAMRVLNERTALRAAQGVEGKHEVHSSGPKEPTPVVANDEADSLAELEGYAKTVEAEEATEVLSTEDMAKKSVDDAWDKDLRDDSVDGDGQPNPPHPGGRP